MTKTETGLLQTVSILVGVMVGGILAYFYNIIIGVPIVDASASEVWNVLIFVTIPVLTGFIAGMISRSKAIENGLMSGLLVGTINCLISSALVVLRNVEEELSYDSGSFAFFLIVMLFLWGVIGAMSGRLAKEYPK
jgi:putative membrane protein (TIGR04086 family)